MKRITPFIIASFILIFPLNGGDDLQEYARNTEKLWGDGTGAYDSTTTAIHASMLGWGVGGAIVIGVIAGVLRQSTSGGSAHGHCH